MNPLYQQLMGMSQPAGNSASPPAFQNPIQRANYIMQAMRNPAAFVKQAFPDVPDGMMNDPGQILKYLQQTRGISDEQIRQLTGMNGR